MKILLCQDVATLGWLGDVVEVTAGYARNYLLPQRLGIVPTEVNLKSLAKEASKRAEARESQKKQLEKIVAAVAGAEAVVAAKANEQGHLFGSITASNIAANLREQGFEVADDVVQLGEHIKQVGTFPDVVLKFAEDLTTTITVVVVAEQEDENESTDQAN